MEIHSANYLISSPDIKSCPKPDKPEYAFIGRSNVGKSSLINMLANNKKLAKISSSPGKTIMINHFLINGGINDTDGWYLVDLPGYGYAKRSLKQREIWEKNLEIYFQNRKNLQSVFVLIDSRIPPQTIDLEFIKKLYYWHIPFHIVFTKTDKEKQSIVFKNINEMMNELKQFMQFVPAKFITSSTKGTGRQKLLTFISDLNLQYQMNKTESL